jgi:hypothetical protein
MTKVYEDLSKVRQTENHLSSINPKAFRKYPFLTLIKEGLNILSHERPTDQSIAETIGLISHIDPEMGLAENQLKNYFSPSKIKYLPPIILIPLLTIACKSDAFIRALIAPFNLFLVNETDKKVLDLIKHRIEETKITNHRPDILVTIATMYEQDKTGIEVDLNSEAIQ